MEINQKESLKNKILEYIYEAILNDEYKPKDQIKELVIAKKFEISRAPIREALLELVGLGILEQVPRCGVFVKDINAKDIFDTYEAKGVIEGFLATSFALSATKKDYQLLDEYVNKMCDKNNSKKQVATIGTKFHKHYLKYVQNEVLLENLNKLNKKSQLLFSKSWSKLYTLDEIKNRHQKIANVLKLKNSIEIEKVIKEHYFETGSKIVALR